ncbi:MAG: O-antigen polysaccharide polymerase Wzy [Beduini sp.]|uniref:O-antigen polysaccharide polymerase Wzy n=1 Tax=Beduini sp. TaxID=1922300 RepID=UPI0039A2BC74
MKISNKLFTKGLSKDEFSLLFILFMTFLTGLFYYFNFISINYTFLTLIAFITIFFITIYYWKIREKVSIFFTIMIYTYTLFTQFGLCFTYYLITKSVVSTYGWETQSFLYSEYYPQVLGLALISVALLVLSALLMHYLIPKKDNSNFRLLNQIEERIGSKIALALLTIVLLYFCYYIVTGKIYLGMDYNDYRVSGVLEGLYDYIIIFYSISICFLVACAKGWEFKIGVILFLITAIILFSCGNRGEVLFPFLACLGIIVYKQQTINYKYILAGAVIVLVFIPVVKVFRHLGDSNLLTAYIEASPLSGLAEMGVSMRMTNYIVTELQNGTREFLNGFSYYNPVINILDHFVPFNIRLEPPIYFNFRNSFYFLKAMTPVAESFANFGLFGVILHHSIIGGVLGVLEGIKPTGIKLGLLASITATLVYATRNVFSGVPAQIFLCLVIYYSIKIISRIFYQRRKVKNYDKAINQ